MTAHLNPCPPGPACHQQAGCKDTACPGHPGRQTIPNRLRVPMLRIVRCTDPSLWYAGRVGSLVPYEGNSFSQGWVSRERGGYRNYVQRNDAQLIYVHVEPSSANSWPFDAAVSYQLRLQDMRNETRKQHSPASTSQAGKQSQSHLASWAEAVANVVLGFGLSVGITAVVMPAFGHHVTLGENLAITAIFTVASLLRSYALRRAFNRWAS